jgi:hypothetical protein
MTQTIIDKEYGILQFVEDFDGNAFWVGKINFKNCVVDIHFDASGDSPTSRQRDFLMHVDKIYEEIVPNIYKVLPEKLKEYNQLAEGAYFVEYFKPKAISIPNEDFQNATWSLVLQSMDNKKHFLSVEFNGYAAKKSFLEK